MATPRIQSVDRAFSLLNCLADGGSTGSLPALAMRCGLSVATTHRLLATLEGLGAVIHVAPGKYRIGTTLFGLTERTSKDRLFAAAAESTLQRMCRTIAHTAHLAVLDPDCMVHYVAKFSRQALSPPTVIGSRLEAYCSGLGKILLAALPPDQQCAYLAEGPFIPLTSRTITEPGALMEELHKVATRGYAVDDREIFEDLRCVAVPVTDREGKVVAALSASSPAGKLPLPEVPQLARALQEHAREIGGKLYPAQCPRRPASEPDKGEA